MSAFQRTLQHFLAERASCPGPVLIDRRRPVGFHQPAEESRRVAHGLERLGVGPDESVALWLPKVPAWFATFFACAQLGAIAVSRVTQHALLQPGSRGFQLDDAARPAALRRVRLLQRNGGSRGGAVARHTAGVERSARRRTS